MGYDPPAMRRRSSRPLLIVSIAVSLVLGSVAFLFNTSAHLPHSVAAGALGAAPRAAPPVTGNTVWPGEGIARGLVLTSSSTPSAVAGYTLDGYGGIHPFGGARAVLGAAHWDTDMARGLVLLDGGGGLLVSGYTLDY